MTQKFQPGDAVVINGTLNATIDFYDSDLDVVRYVTKANSSTDTTTAHISQTRIEAVAPPAPRAEELPLDVTPKAEKK